VECPNCKTKLNRKDRFSLAFKGEANCIVCEFRYRLKPKNLYYPLYFLLLFIFIFGLEEVKESYFISKQVAGHIFFSISFGILAMGTVYVFLYKYSDIVEVKKERNHVNELIDKLRNQKVQTDSSIDETSYLLKSPTNKKRLTDSIERLEKNKYK